MIFPQLQQLLEKIVNIHSPVSKVKSDLGGFITGASLGVLWTPCAGPILAAVAMLTARQMVNLSIIIIFISYALGAALPIFTLVLAEQWFFIHYHRLTKLTRIVQVAAGIIMIVGATLIYTHYDKVLWAKITPHLPFVPKNLTQLEEIKPVKEQLAKLKISIPTLPPTPTTIYISPTSPALYPKAPEITGIVKWFNTENNSPILLKNLRGKVVLLDFWTYTCASCIPNISHLKNLQQKYQDQGLVVVSIHTPGYAEAKLEENVKAAIERYQVTYPVAMDNDWKTFDAYKNNYWPTEYLIDINGYIRYSHEGGGEYEKTEQKVVELLKEAGFMK